TWGTVTGKPLTFPPAEHTHAAPGWEDVTGKPLAFPPAEHSHAAPGWEDVTGKPIAFPPAEHTHAAPGWEDVTDKPLAFPPAEHSHTANTWEEVTGKPLAFPPAAHDHSWESITDKPESFPPSLDGISGVLPAASLTTVGDADVMPWKISAGGLIATMTGFNFKSWVRTWLTKVSNLIGGNSTTLKGAIPYQSDTDTTSLLSPNTSTVPMFLRMLGTGSNGASPTWSTFGGMWETKTSNFTAVSGGAYNVNCGTGNIAVTLPSGTMNDLIFFLVSLANGSASATINGKTYRETANCPVVLRNNNGGTQWVTLEPIAPKLTDRSSSFTAEKGRAYSVNPSPSPVTVSDPTDGSTGDTYLVYVTAAAYSTTIGGTTYGASSIPVVRYHNGSSWNTVARVADSVGKTTNLVGGNSSTLLGALPYQSNTDTTTLLSPNTSAVRKFLRMTGTGTNGAAPAWDDLWEIKTSSFTAVAGGRYKVYSSGSSLSVSPPTTATTNDTVEVLIMFASNTYPVTVGTDTYYSPTGVPVVMRCTGNSSWSVVPNVIQFPANDSTSKATSRAQLQAAGYWEVKTSSFTAEKNGRYLINPSGGVVITEPSSTVNDTYEFRVVGDMSTTTVSGTVYPKSAQEYVRRCTGGSSWETVAQSNIPMQYKSSNFTAVVGGDYTVYPSGNSVTVSDPSSASPGDSYCVTVVGGSTMYGAMVGSTTYYTSSQAIIRRYTGGSWETVTLPAYGLWTYKTNYSSFVAENGGRYLLDYGCTVSDPTSPMSGFSYQCIVFGNSTACTIGGASYFQSSDIITRYYNGSSWNTIPVKVPWEYKISSFTAVKGGRYACDYTTSVTDPYSATSGDLYEVMVLSSSVTVGGATGFTPSPVPVVRRYNGASWETLSLNTGWTTASGSQQAANGGKYVVKNSSVSFTDPSGSTGYFYEVLVMGSAASATFGTTIKYQSPVPYIRRYNGASWETMVSPTDKGYYDAGMQYSSFYPSDSNGRRQKFYPSSSGSFTLNPPSGAFYDGDEFEVLLYCSYGSCSLSFSSITVPSTFGNVSTPISMTSGKRYWIKLQYINYTWCLVDLKGGY
ncbi:MAG: hypothetical protein WCP45_05970, partial [Verrucomicrobiota bacterium]